MGVEDKDEGYKAFFETVKVIGSGDSRLIVGFLEGSGQRVGGAETSSTPVAEYAAINEYGAPAANIPARPFMSTTMDENRDRYARLAREYVMRIILASRRSQQSVGKGAAIIALKRLGNDVRNDLIKQIVAWDEPPNAESTVRQKGADNPLVDSGHMQRAIVWEIRQGNQGGE